MSVRAMSAVWELDLPDSDKLVLLALADCANDEGHCWPSVASLVRKCSKSERTIQGSIKRLVEWGHITRREVVGKGCNYTVHPNRSRITPAENAPRDNCAPQRTTQTPAAAADKPSRTINTEAKASCDRVLAYWKSTAVPAGYPDVEVMNPSRKQRLLARLKEVGEAKLIEAIDLMVQSIYLRGKGVRKKPANFDFMLQPDKLPRILEGFYSDEPKPKARQERDAAWYERQAVFFESINDNDKAEDCRRRAASLAGAVPIGEIAAQMVGRA